MSVMFGKCQHNGYDASDCNAAMLWGW